MIIVPFEESHFDLAKPISMATYWPDLWEERDTYRAKMKLFPEGCLSVFHNEEGKEPQYIGYIFGHPWKGNYIPLDTPIESIPADPDHYYIHDLLVDKKFRGLGIGAKLFRRMLAIAWELNLPEMRLVSVLDSDSFWEKLGFKTTMKFNYASEVPAKFMIRKLIS